MPLPTSLRSLFLASAFLLTTAPGCQGEDPPAPPPESTTRVSEQGLACGASLVPVMTSPTLPSGTVTRSGAFDSASEAWKAFDGADSMWLSQQGQAPAWIAYQFASGTREVTHYAIKYTNGSITSRAPKSWTFEGWNGSAWVALDTRTQETGWLGNERREYAVAHPGAFSRYRLNVTDDNDARAGIEVLSIGRLELFSCECTLTNQVPTMTSPTLPSGAVTRSGAYDATFEAWKAFDSSDAYPSMWLSQVGQTPAWIAYEWPDGSRRLLRYAIRFINGSLTSRAPRSWTFEGWNGTAWVVLDTRPNETGWLGNDRREYTIATPGAFSKYRLNVTDDNDTRATTIETISMGRLELLGCVAPDTLAPAAPVLTGFTPASPSTSTQPTLSGTAEPGATVRVFSGSACAGQPLALLTAAADGTFSRAFTVAANTTSTFTATATDASGNRSACSTVASYRQDGTPPPAPSQLRFSPASPGSSLTPVLSGLTEGDATVRIFQGSGCVAPAVAQGTADAAGAFSLQVSASANATSSFSALAEDVMGQTSPCSALATYVHDGIGPVAPTFLDGFVPFDSAPFVGAVRAQTEPRGSVAVFSDVACTVPVPTATQVDADAAGHVLVPLTQEQLGAPLFAVAFDAVGNRSACVSFQSGCQVGFEDCDGDPSNGCEADLMTDEAHCGACGTMCGGAPSAQGVCGAGTCGLGCAVGSFDCDGDAANGCESATACASATCAVNPDAELLITAVSVVDDPVRTRGTGAWTFGTLLRQMNGGRDPSELVRTWLRTWEEDQSIGASFVPARQAIRPLVLGPWEARSGGPGQPLNFNLAPLRLLAIVNRMDLRRENVHAGEGRFVFGVLDPNGNPTQFTVILEYTLPGGGPEEFQRWARDWHELGRLGVTHPDYNAKLQALTDRFAGSFVARGTFLGSAISQVRTNEIALAPEWELREFHFRPEGLVPSPVALTPALFHNNSPLLASFITQNQAAILAETHDVPPFFQGQPFLWGSAPTPNNVFWNAPGVDAEARHKFSLNTCSGCHAGETRTGFLHVGIRGAGQRAFLSPFLTSTSATPDPVNPAKTRVFNDLGRRGADLKALVCGVPTTTLAKRAGEPSARAVPGFPARSNLPAGRVH